jgi:hypothetical protein
MSYHRNVAPWLLCALLVGCAAPDDAQLPANELEHACAGTATLPVGLSLDPFYDQYCVAHGLAIVASDEVPAAALERSRSIVSDMLEHVPAAVVEALVQSKVRIGVIGADQVTTDLPEHADLNEAFPTIDWDERTRGVAATPSRPLTSSAEENLLCDPSDPYAGESILVHEFAHTVHLQGVRSVDATFDARLVTAFEAAMAASLWHDTYAATNAEEYWAEGVQSYFDVNNESDPPDGVHNEVDTRAELAGYDPALHGLVEEVFGAAELTTACP